MEVERSFAFVDLCGFTAYTESSGVLKATQLLSSFRAAGREIASRRGVRIAKWLGDGAMIVGIEARPVVEALLEAEERMLTSGSTLGLRFGVTWGSAILFEGDDYIGSVVNLAARLCDAAAPNEILAGPGVEEFLPPWAEPHEVGVIEVPGFGGVLPRVGVALKHSDHAVVDPVCGLSIPPEDAVARAVGPGGEAVHFCSEACEATWQALLPTS